MGTSDVLKVHKIAQTILSLTEPIKINNFLILYLRLVRKRLVVFKRKVNIVMAIYSFRYNPFDSSGSLQCRMTT